MSSPKILPPHFQDMIHAYELDALLARMSAKQILTLDCFDTMFDFHCQSDWRFLLVPKALVRAEDKMI